MLDNISIFIEVVKQGSFSKASQQLNIPSSTVSRRVSELESLLGVRLLERNSRKLNLTEKGAFLLEQSANPIRQIKQNVQDITARWDNTKGRLRVTAPVLIGNELLNEWFCDFMLLNPGIELEILLSNQYEDILDGNIDVAFRIGPLQNSQFIAQYLFSSQFRMYANSAYIKQFSKHISTLDGWQKQSMLLLKQHEKKMDAIHSDTGEKIQLNLKARMCSNDIAVVRQGAMSGLGIAYLPDFCVRSQVKSEQLIEVTSDYEFPSKRDIYAVYPSKKHLSHMTRTFIDYIKSRVENGV